MIEPAPLCISGCEDDARRGRSIDCSDGMVVQLTNVSAMKPSKKNRNLIVKSPFSEALKIMSEVGMDAILTLQHPLTTAKELLLHALGCRIEAA